MGSLGIFGSFVSAEYIFVNSHRRYLKIAPLGLVPRYTVPFWSATIALIVQHPANFQRAALRQGPRLSVPSELTTTSCVLPLAKSPIPFWRITLLVTACAGQGDHRTTTKIKTNLLPHICLLPFTITVLLFFNFNANRFAVADDRIGRHALFDPVLIWPRAQHSLVILQDDGLAGRQIAQYRVFNRHTACRQYQNKIKPVTSYLCQIAHRSEHIRQIVRAEFFRRSFSQELFIAHRAGYRQFIVAGLRSAGICRFIV